MENKEETTEGVKTEEVGKVDTQATEKENKTEVYKAFKTEEEYNNAVKSILKQKLPPKEEMDAYKQWKENQKTAEEKQAEKEKEYQETSTKNTTLEKENKVLRKGVNIDDVDYVIFKVSKMEGEFEDNLSAFLTDNPKFTTQEVNQETVNLGGEHKNSGSVDLSKMSYEEYKKYRKNN